MCRLALFIFILKYNSSSFEKSRDIIYVFLFSLSPTALPPLTHTHTLTIPFFPFDVSAIAAELAIQTNLNSMNSNLNVAITNETGRVNTILMAYSTTPQMNVAINTALLFYPTAAVMNAAINSALLPYSTTTAVYAAITTALLAYPNTTVTNTAITTALLAYPNTTVLATTLASYSNNSQLPANLRIKIDAIGPCNLSSTGAVRFALCTIIPTFNL